MTQKESEPLTSALVLSPSEREELADCLWDSLETTDACAGMTEAEFVAKLHRRAADPSLGVPWDEVRNMR